LKKLDKLIEYNLNLKDLLKYIFKK